MPLKKIMYDHYFVEYNNVSNLPALNTCLKAGSSRSRTSEHLPGLLGDMRRGKGGGWGRIERSFVFESMHVKLDSLLFNYLLN